MNGDPEVVVRFVFPTKIEWVGLLERHPEEFKKAQSLEKNAIDRGYHLLGVRTKV